MHNHLMTDIHHAFSVYLMETPERSVNSLAAMFMA